MTDAPHFWTPHHIQAITAGQWLTKPPQPTPPLDGLSIDSRSISPNQIFLAILGQRFDGHDFLQPAIDAGAAFIIVQRHDCLESIPSSPVPVLLVNDTLLALHHLAYAYRDLLRTNSTTVIAVVGSNGKTTTRHMIHHVLSVYLRGTQSPKSFNNHIGVPLTLLAANPLDDFIVVEIGTNNPGETHLLAQIVRPDAVVITSIGHEHMQSFKNLTAIAKEHAAVLPFIAQHGTAIINDSAFLILRRVYRCTDELNVTRYGQHHSSAQIKFTPAPLSDQAHGTHFTIDGKLTIDLPLYGTHNAFNATATVATARWMGLPDQTIRQALATITAAPMRTEVIQIHPTASPDRAATPLVLINDAYNANLDSTFQALITLATHPVPTPGGRRIAILGDMLELGSLAPRHHRIIGAWVAALTQSSSPAIHHAILIGTLSAHTAQALATVWPRHRITVFPQHDQSVSNKVASLLRPGDVVLLKASRAMQLENLIPAIKTAITNYPCLPSERQTSSIHHCPQPDIVTH